MSETLRENIIQAYQDGIRGNELSELVEGQRRIMANEIIMRAINRGKIEDDLGWDDDREAAEIAFHQANGDFDLAFAMGREHARSVNKTVKSEIDSYRQVLIDAGNFNRRWANKELEGTGITLEEGEFGLNRAGDPDGTMTFQGTDGETYRIIGLETRGSHNVRDRQLQRMENGQWVNAFNNHGQFRRRVEIRPGAHNVPNR